ncbi:hypothetical protein DFH09DRAFT_411443 [Mycena vulgaris]|nr:hypothetical protein DFH09DRAFT_411443 [Mycena vulgaris]
MYRHPALRNAQQAWETETECSLLALTMSTTTPSTTSFVFDLPSPRGTGRPNATPTSNGTHSGDGNILGYSEHAVDPAKPQLKAVGCRILLYYILGAVIALIVISVQLWLRWRIRLRQREFHSIATRLSVEEEKIPRLFDTYPAEKDTKGLWEDIMPLAVSTTGSDSVAPPQKLPAQKGADVSPPSRAQMAVLLAMPVPGAELRDTKRSDDIPYSRSGPSRWTCCIELAHVLACLRTLTAHGPPPLGRMAGSRAR